MIVQVSIYEGGKEPTSFSTQDERVKSIAISPETQTVKVEYENGAEALFCGLPFKHLAFSGEKDSPEYIDWSGWEDL